MAEFQKYPKTPRWNREWVITEKIDGTNAAVVIERDPLPELPVPHKPIHTVTPYMTGDGYHVYAQSRNRFITPESDNFGFAKWVNDNALLLVQTLGEGIHFGEWAGPGIQGNPHDLLDRHFFLFNVKRWNENLPGEAREAGLAVVPVLFDGDNGLDTANSLHRAAGRALTELRHGSYASFVAEDNTEVSVGKAEGIIIYSTAANQAFKVTLENDDKPKGLK